MKPGSVVIAISCLLCAQVLSPVYAQNTSFIKTYGGPKYDCGFSVQQTRDGGFIFAGTTTTLTNNWNDVYVVRTDVQGDTVWTRAIGGHENNDEGWCVHETSAGSFIIAGTSTTSNAASMLLIKLDTLGTVVWTKSFSRSPTDYAYSVCETADSGFAIAGILGLGPHGGSDAYMVKTNQRGDTLWTRTFGGTRADGARSIQRLPDGGFILAGYSNSFSTGSFDHYVIRTNASGDTLWTRTYGGPDHETAWSVDRTFDGGFIIGGSVRTGVPPSDISLFYLVKTNMNGDTIWTRTIAGASLESSASVRQTSDSGFVIAGATNASGQHPDMLLVKTNQRGDSMWSRTYGDAIDDYGWSVQQCTDNGYIIAGLGYGNSYDACMIKTNEMGLVVGFPEESSPGIAETFHLYQNYPNPFNPSTTIRYSIPVGTYGHTSLRVYDVLGREVAMLTNETKQPGSYSVQWDASEMRSGVYFYQLRSGSFVSTKKLILLR